jgi:hypothetical protein
LEAPAQQTGPAARGAGQDGDRDPGSLAEATPEAVAAEFPQWRMPAQAGAAWITMRSGPQEYYGP